MTVLRSTTWTLSMQGKMKNRPGPLALREVILPSLRITALSYSFTIWNEESEEGSLWSNLFVDTDAPAYLDRGNQRKWEEEDYHYDGKEGQDARTTSRIFDIVHRVVPAWCCIKIQTELKLRRHYSSSVAHLKYPQRV